jgi:uncharacterized protein YcbX
VIRVSALYVHPIKGCAGIPVASAEVTPRGLANDRRWMVVDAEGTFVSQRERAEMVLARTALATDAAAIDLVAPGLPPLRLPLRHEAGPRREIRVWDDRGQAVVHAEGSAWFSRFLGAPHQLVYMPDDARRAVSLEYGRPGDIVSFADAYPLLLISQASLDDLNARLDTPIVMERFRPNVVVEGCPPFDEDSWPTFQVGALAFRGPKPCSRCVVTTVDPDTGLRGKEPLRTLATYRQRDGKVWFGMNVVPDATGTLRIGDELRARADGQVG